MKNQKFNLLLKPNPTRVMLLSQLMLLLLHQFVDLVQAIFLDSLGLLVDPFATHPQAMFPSWRTAIEDILLSNKYEFIILL